MNNTFNNLGNLVDNFTSTVVKAIGTLMLASATVAFFIGIVQFIWAKREGNGEKAKVGQNFMLWGLIALFVMFSVWGIITFFGRTLGIQTGGNINIPSFNFVGGQGGGTGAAGTSYTSPSSGWGNTTTNNNQTNTTAPAEGSACSEVFNGHIYQGTCIGDAAPSEIRAACTPAASNERYISVTVRGKGYQCPQ